jgi:hypothetical protein
MSGQGASVGESPSGVTLGLHPAARRTTGHPHPGGGLPPARLQGGAAGARTAGLPGSATGGIWPPGDEEGATSWLA